MGQPLFILAPPRSFTSVTCSMLGQHPEMYGLPETNLFIADNYRQLSRMYRVFRPRLGHGLLRAMAELGFGEQTARNIRAAKAWLLDHPFVTTGELFQLLIEWSFPRRLVDKSPIYVFDIRNLERIKSCYPGAQYLHLIRHPTGTCESVIKISGELEKRERAVTENRIRLSKGSARFMSRSKLHPDNIWLKPHLRILEFLKGIAPQKKMHLRGEDLLSGPDFYLTRIAEWLGISTAKDAVEAMKHPERSPFACYGPRNARMGNDPSFLEKPELRPYRQRRERLDRPMTWDPDVKFSDELKGLAAKLGYGELISPELSTAS